MKYTIERVLSFIRPKLSSTLFISVGISLFLSLVSVNLSLYRVEAYFYDLRMRWKGEESPHPDIMLLSIENDSASIEAHLAALKNLVKQKPKSILYLNRFDPIDIESNPAVAEEFVTLANNARKEGVQIIFGTEVDLAGEILPPYPLSLLPNAPSMLHKDGTMFAEDKVMRRALLTTFFNKAAIHLEAAFPDLNKKELFEKAQKIRGAYFYEPAEAWHVMIRFPSDTRANDSQFPRISLANAAKGENVSKAAGKIILVETLRKEAMNDFAYTPYSRLTYENPRLVVHAAILDTILKNRGIVVFSNIADFLLTFFLSLTLAFIAITMSPSRGVAALITLSATTFLFSLLLFRLGYWAPLVHPLVAMFFTYYLIVPYRAILEYKKRWEVQEKHDLLVQVEEMKGNFLSLMSHDLKTPVARIQGLAELVLRQGNLLPQQVNEIQQILASTESLDKFISKILNLTKVESNELKIQKKSKDVNKIIEQCVTKLEFQAKAKNISIDVELEPLFPIHIDASLINQVVTNIIDNAIKYSPAGSSVRISSREINEFVEIIIEDSGPGLDEDEQQQLFTKFFRGKTYPGDTNNGSGLGLYLSKYFIELHNGRVQAYSRKGFGSKFSIQLPIQGNTV